MNVCHYCGCKSGDFDHRFGADVELRPYGPNASFDEPGKAKRWRRARNSLASQGVESLWRLSAAGRSRAPQALRAGPSTPGGLGCPVADSGGSGAPGVCFYCANETPERSAEVIKQMAIHFDAAFKAGDGPKIIVLGEETGPRPLVTKSQ